MSVLVEPRPTAVRGPLLRRKRTTLPLAAATLLLSVLFLVWPAVYSHLEAFTVLELVSGQPVPHAVGNVVTHRVKVEDITVPLSSGPVRARVYLPTDAPHAPAMVVLHGVHHLGIDEPRLEGFASAMASCGLRVLTPELPDIKDYHIGPASVKTIGDSAIWYAAQTGGAPVGVMGLSFSGGLALLAASDPVYEHAIKFVFAVGSQASMPRVAEYYRTGRDLRPDGTIQALAAHEYGPLVLEYQHLEDFATAADIVALRTVLRAHLYEDSAGEKKAMAVLTALQQAMAKRLMNTADPQTQLALAASEVKHREEMLALSPAGHLKTMHVPVYLLHGEADNVIPATETLWMQRELPSTMLQSALVSPVLGHVDVNSSVSTMDQWKLVHLMAMVLHAEETH